MRRKGALPSRIGMMRQYDREVKTMKYEMLYLIDASIAEEARDALIAKFEDTV